MADEMRVGAKLDIDIRTGYVSATDLLRDFKKLMERVNASTSPMIVVSSGEPRMVVMSRELFAQIKDELEQARLSRGEAI